MIVKDFNLINHILDTMLSKYLGNPIKRGPCLYSVHGIAGILQEGVNGYYRRTK